MDVDISKIKDECSIMTDKQLIESLTIDRLSYTDDFNRIALAELRQRKDITSSAKVSLNNEDEITLPIEEAAAKMGEDISMLDSWQFTNFLNETLLIQKGFSYWEIHYLFLGTYTKTFFIHPLETVKDILLKFLNCEKWDDMVEEVYHVNEWIMFVTSNSFRYTERMAEKLFQSQIIYVVETEVISNVINIYSPYVKASLTIFIPYAKTDEANIFLEEDKEKIDSLYDSLSDIDNLEKELEIYNELIELDPDDAMAFHNRGVIFYEQEQYKESGESFIEAASLVMTLYDTDELLEEAEEILEEAENALLQLTGKRPDDLDILHTLGSIFWHKGELSKAKEYYEKILALKPDDEASKESIEYLEAQQKISDNT